MEVDGYKRIIGVGMSLIPVDHICKEGAGPSLLGYYWPHQEVDGTPCPAYFMHICKEHGAKEAWEQNGLNLKPSLLCERCGLHGFVTNGRWVGIGAGPAGPDWPEWAKEEEKKQRGGRYGTPRTVDSYHYFNGRRIKVVGRSPRFGGFFGEFGGI